ncbi:MAG: hypothetical protein M3425_08610 [Actinomycetota bacterium]|jgi:hypothetical protein|nr:hypothetical protein [Euzebyales bacterium]MDQ3343936.1 hypothetical protein [Actinomycetota bacterium]MDQ3529992.1 hypothetical protein [Actinomycetota bacterium]
MNSRVAIVTVALLLAGCGAAAGNTGAVGDDGGDRSVGGAEPGSKGSGQILCAGPDEPAPAAPPGTDCSVPPEPEATLVTPQPGMVGVRAVPWTSATDMGRTVTVTWVSGVAPCTILDRVEVSEGRRRVTLTLFEGSDPQAQGMPCIESAQYKAVRVLLDQPVGDRRLVDGAVGRTG